MKRSASPLCIKKVKGLLGCVGAVLAAGEGDTRRASGTCGGGHGPPSGDTSPGSSPGRRGASCFPEGAGAAATGTERRARRRCRRSAAVAARAGGAERSSHGPLSRPRLTALRGRRCPLAPAAGRGRLSLGAPGARDVTMDSRFK